MRPTSLIALAGAIALAGCATPKGLPPVSVTAVAETVPVGTGVGEDAADDPAIWRNAANPAQSLIVATDKKAGLYVYGLDGKVRSFFDAGQVNNVALVDMGAAGVIVVASDRNDLTQAKLPLFRLDTASATLQPIGSLPGGAGEGYGVCAYRDGAQMRIASVLKAGTIVEQVIAFGPGGQVAPVAATFPERKLLTQTEGCVYDPRDSTLYVGEEDVGIWRFAPGASEGQLVAPIDNKYLVADVEGLALITEGATDGWLVASSQGDNAFAVFELPGMTYLGRFAVTAGTLGGAEETDGIELVSGDFGPAFPDGLFVAQDGWNEPNSQNFKLVSWAAIKAALAGSAGR
ncbi:MAG: hypothetical protein B7Z08_04190 [Sphingomonadales bacterium 32-68-7]|nr:MAG: hypothetical protein B7Z33_13625 [Sphingomonadales bacterium 12-68-11]OYX09729.1 MAG: hypothetical protein B7Z08_04190 [Sphingomonadales bacterium 32-68-7]